MFFASGKLHAGENYKKFLTEKTASHAGWGSQSGFFPKFLIIFTGSFNARKNSYFISLSKTMLIHFGFFYYYCSILFFFCICFATKDNDKVVGGGDAGWEISGRFRGGVIGVF